MPSPRGDGGGGGAPPPPDFDVLVVNDPGLIDLDTPETADFPFCGSPVEVDAEARRVEHLLSAGTDGASASASGPPSRRRKAPRPKPLPSASYGHSSARVREIEAANGRLVRRLVAVAAAPAALQTAAKEHDLHMANVAASSARRRRQEEESVAGDNLWLYRRLQSVKPSKAVAKEALERDYEASRRHATGARREATRPSPPGMAQARPWDDRWHMSVIS